MEGVIIVVTPSNGGLAFLAAQLEAHFSGCCGTGGGGVEDGSMKEARGEEGTFQCCSTLWGSFIMQNSI